MTRTPIGVSAVAATAAAAFFVMSEAARGHDWYPLACCSGIDCGPASVDEVRYTPKGWLVLPTHELIAFDKAQTSPDGRFHRCTWKAHDPTSKTRCLFVPDTGS